MSTFLNNSSFPFFQCNTNNTQNLADKKSYKLVWSDFIKGTVHTKAFNHMKGTQKGIDYKLPDCEDVFMFMALSGQQIKLISL